MNSSIHDGRADRVLRVELKGVRSKKALLETLATGLALPRHFGHNWDALADCLRDPAWRPAWGHVFVFEHPESLPPHDAAILRGVLDDAATFAIEHDRPFFAFFPLPAAAPGADA